MDDPNDVFIENTHGKRIRELETENNALRFALAIRCRHGYKLTQPCQSCAEATEEGCERIIYLDPDGVHLKSKELLFPRRLRHVKKSPS